VPIDEFLIACASLAESSGLADLRVMPLGVGKTAAALSLSGLRQRPDVRAVLLFGVAGAYPDRHRVTPAPVRRGGLCIVGSDRFGDEGIETPTGFQDLHAMRLGDCGPFPANPRMAQQAAALLGAPIVRGVTVSTCSGTDSASERMARRSGADVETMEGAAVAYVCRQFELPMLHVRAISNWTGDRGRGEWDLGAAVDAVGRAVRRLWSGA
jgi:futalosine hydrolase